MRWRQGGREGRGGEERRRATKKVVRRLGSSQAHSARLFDRISAVTVPESSGPFGRDGTAL